MEKITYITPDFAVAAFLKPEDFASLAQQGFKSVINNRPDAEEDGQPSATDLSVHAEKAGLSYHHVPASKMELFCDDTVEQMQNALQSADGPILAHCLSGIRSAIVWAAATSRSEPVDEVLGRLDKAGFELDFLRDDLDQQANRARVFASVPGTPKTDENSPISTWDAVRGAINRLMPWQQQT